MKLRLVLFSSCTLLFSSLSSLSLNAQQEREARLRVTTALPALAANGAKPEFGPNVLIFDPAMPSQAIQKQIDAVYSTQEHNEFGQQRNALLFLPGNYSVDVPVGFYTRSEEHTSELQSRQYLVCRLLLEKKKNRQKRIILNLKKDINTTNIHKYIHKNINVYSLVMKHSNVKP